MLLKSTVRTGLFACGLAVSFAAGSGAFGQAGAARPAAAETSTAQPSALTDPQIAEIAAAANQIDIDAGRLAERKAHSKDVKAFAKLMVTDHSAVLKQAQQLLKKLKVKPEASAVSKALQSGAKANIAALKKLKGNAFDKHYVDHEVAFHQQLLDALDQTLIPGAKNAQLKALLEKVRPAIATHLEHAKKVQSELAKKK